MSAGSLTGRTALVTGGTSGIGRATAARLVAAGAAVVATGRRAHAEDGIRTLTLDLTEPAACREAVRQVVEIEGRLDILVNNAGTMLVDEVLAARPEDWAQMAAVNLLAATECTRVALPYLLDAAGQGHCADIVFIGSLAARAPSTGRAFYAATKSAIAAFADVLRVELAPTNVRVGVVLPGLTDTGLRSANRPEALAKMKRAAAGLADVTPLPPERIAEAVGWLLSQPTDTAVSELTVLPVHQPV